MNDARRKVLRDLQSRLDTFGSRVTELRDGLEEIKSELDDAKEGEQEAFDNLPESLQNSDRGSVMTQAIEEMESAADLLEQVYEALDVDKLTEAAAAMDNAEAA